MKSKPSWALLAMLLLVSFVGSMLPPFTPSLAAKSFSADMLAVETTLPTRVRLPASTLGSSPLASTLVWDFGEDSGGANGWGTHGWECEGFYGWPFWVLDPELGGDPWIVKDGMSRDSSNYWAVQIRMLSRADNGDNIFWKTSSSNYFSGDKSRPLAVIPDSEWHLYTIRVNNHAKWTGTITGLRIDPAHDGRPNTCGTDYDNIYVDWVKLLHDGTAPTNPTSVNPGCTATNNTWQNTCQNPNFTWSGASDDQSGVEGYYVYWGTSSSGNPTTWTTSAGYDPGTVPNPSTYYLRVKTKDKAGNVSPATTLFILKYDKTMPTNPTSTNPHCTATSGVWQNTCPDPDFTWTGASDTGSGVRGFYRYWGTSSSGTPSTWTTLLGYDPPAPASEHTYYLRVRTKDYAGNVSGAETLYTFKYDGTAPAGVFTDPDEGETIYDSVYMKVDASDGGSGMDRVEFEANYDGSYHTLHTDSSAPYEYTWDTSGISNQCMTLRGTMYDNVGNWEYTTVGVCKGVAPDDLMIDGSLVLDPQRVPHDVTDVEGRFTVHNHSGSDRTVKLRAKVDTGSCTFAETGDVTIPAGGDFAYVATASCFVPGIYQVTAEYYDNVAGSWQTLLGDGTRALQVLVPPPAPVTKLKADPPHCGSAGEPVNTATGNFGHQHTDFVVPGPGLDLRLVRWYNALDAADSAGPFGYGWSFNYGTWLDWRVDDTVVVTLPDGHTAYFVGNLDGTYEPDDGVTEELIRNPDDSFDLTDRNQIVYHYDATGLLASITTEDGFQQTFAYDGGGHLVTATDTAGIETTFAYDGDYIGSITSTVGITFTYTYSGGDLTAVTNSAGESMTYTYDAEHRMLAAADATGRIYVSNTYDVEGRVVAQEDAKGQTWTFDYDDATHTVTVEEPGRFVIHTYNDDNQLIQEEDAYGHTISYTWDVDNNLLATKDKNGAISQYSYDERGNRLSRTDALGHIWNYTYDEENHLVSETDPLGHTTTYAYDDDGHLVSVIDAAGSVTTYEYGPEGLPVREVDASGHETLKAYNELGLTTAITDALGGVTTMTYDGQGSLLTYTDAAGQVVAYGYDAEGRPVEIVGPRGFTTTFTYHDNGQLASETDALGHTRVYTYDENTNLSAQTDWSGNVYTYVYDSANRRIAEIDSLGGTITYTYDLVGNLVRSKDKRGYVTEYAYDPVGNLLTETNPLGQETSYEYDLLGQALTVTHPCSCGGDVRVGRYDAAGRVVEEIDGLGNSTFYSYDALGRTVAITDALGYRTDTFYDPVGNVLAQTDALGQVTTYAYDPLNRPVTATNRLGFSSVTSYDAVGREVSTTDERGFTTHYAYDSGDNPVTVTDPEGRTTTYEYDALGRLVTETNALGHTWTYTYDPLGNRTTTIDPEGQVTTYVYDALGRKTAATDPLGSVTAYTYDPGGRLETVTDPEGRVTTYIYDALGRQTAVIDPRGGVTSTEYDLAGNVGTRIDASGQRWTYTYDANSNLLTEIDPLGNVTAYAYDALNRQVEITDALGGLSLTIYDAAGRTVETITPADQHTRYAYDAEGQVLEIENAAGCTTTFGYDPAGNRTIVVDPEGRTTTYEYDSLNRPIRTIDALGGVTLSVFDAVGNRVAVTDALSRTTTYVYDAKNRMVNQIDALGEVITYTYDVLDRQITSTDAHGHMTEYEYDAVGQLLTLTLPGGQQTVYAYDGSGNRVAQADALGQVSTWDYDLLNRPVTETSPLGHQTVTAYDALGRKTSARDPNGRTTQYDYDGLGRLTRVENALGHETCYVYDPVGNLLYRQDGNDDITRYAYDDLNRLVRETNPLGKTWLYQYDRAGNQVARQDALGQVTTYTYDALNRLAAIQYPDGSSVTFAYDAVGNRVVMSDGQGATTYAYDELGRMTTITDPQSQRVTYEYDAVGNQIAIAYPGGVTVTHGYDANDWLAEVTDHLGGTTVYIRNDRGLVTRVTYANGAGISYDYDDAGRLVGLTNDSPVLGEFVTYTYTLDAAGNRVQSVETTTQPSWATVTRQYTYDALDQLVDSVASDGTELHYVYDAVGNRPQMNGMRLVDGSLEAFSQYYTYNAADQLLAVRSGAGQETRYGYDASGNRVEEGNLSSRIEYSYDAENRLLSAAVYDWTGAEWTYRNGVRETYTYDGLGRRVEKTAWVTDTAQVAEHKTYLYDRLWNVLQEESDVGGNPTTTLYTYDEGMTKLGAYDGGTAHHFHYDGLGSVLGYTDGAGDLSDPGGLAAYGDYGQVEGNAGALLTGYGYTGHELDSYTGLAYAKHRYYDAATGMWLSRDPSAGFEVDPMSQHRYQYAHNNPINRVDLLGLFDWATGTIEWGDTLWAIAQAYWGQANWDRVWQIAGYNNISDPNKIYAGQHLELPPSSKKGMPQSRPVQTTKQASSASSSNSSSSKHGQLGQQQVESELTMPLFCGELVLPREPKPVNTSGQLVEADLWLSDRWSDMAHVRAVYYPPIPGLFYGSISVSYGSLHVSFFEKTVLSDDNPYNSEVEDAFNSLRSGKQDYDRKYEWAGGPPRIGIDDVLELAGWVYVGDWGQAAGSVLESLGFYAIDQHVFGDVIKAAYSVKFRAMMLQLRVQDARYWEEDYSFGNPYLFGLGRPAGGGGGSSW